MLGTHKLLAFHIIFLMFNSVEPPPTYISLQALYKSENKAISIATFLCSITESL